jgi:Flp pilus assembly protein TadG
MRRRQRGSTLVESALALASFAVLVAGIMELGFAGFAANSISFAAQRAARFASVRGSASGHAASVTDVQAVAQQYAAPLSAGAMTVDVSWSPDKSPGSTVEVRVSYSFAREMMPVASRVLRFQSTARQVIVQ